MLEYKVRFRLNDDRVLQDYWVPANTAFGERINELLRYYIYVYGKGAVKWSFVRDGFGETITRLRVKEKSTLTPLDGDTLDGPAPGIEAAHSAKRDRARWLQGKANVNRRYSPDMDFRAHLDAVRGVKK